MSYYIPMNAEPKPRLQRQRSWTAAQRDHQSRLLRSRRIWLTSTGPKTIEGKAASSKNARHADYDDRMASRTEMRLIKGYLRTQKSYSDLLNLFLKQEHSLSIAKHNAYIDALFFLENELIDIERKMFGGLRFSEITGMESRRQKQNIIPFPDRPPPS